MNRNSFRTWALLGSLALFASACSEASTPLEQSPEPGPALFGAAESFNGVGACMGNDAYNSGITTGMNSPSSLNCTAKEVYLATAAATHVCTDATGTNCTAVAQGEVINCTTPTIFVRVTAQIGQNSTSDRSDVGVWINPTANQARVGNSCRHYNLLNNQDGVKDGDGDQCGDMFATRVDVPLGVLEVACTPGPTGKVLLGSCLAWTQPGGDIVCPVAGANDGAGGFRFGTVPANKAKCNCEPFELNIFVPGTVTIEKVAIGGDGTFDYTSAALGAFSLTTVGGQKSQVFTNVAHGPGSVTETDPAPGWDFVSLECNASGTGTTVSTSGRTANFNIATGGNVHCTYTNRKRAQITIKKVTVPAASPGNFTFTQNIDGTGSFQLAHNGTKTFQNVLATGAQTYNVTESALAADFDLTDIACIGTDSENWSGNTATGALSVTPQAGEAITCTFTNTKRGTIIIEKQTNPDGSAVAFAFTGDVAGSLTDGQTASQSVAPGTYTSTEGAVAGWVLTGISCDDANSTGNTATRTATFRVEAGETVKCTFTNERLARLIVQKTVVGGVGPSFEFSRTGIANFNLSHGDENDSGFALAPGDYTVCERDLAAAWSATLTVNGVPASLTNPDHPEDYGHRCRQVSVAYGSVTTLVFTNSPPPGGDARTIGYWRNWSSCSGGNQWSKAGEKGMATLDGHLPQLIGDLNVTNCAQGVNILSKRNLSGKNMASDAAYGLAAQLLAAKLNISAGADPACGVAATIAQAQTLLDNLNFTGNGDYLGSKANAALRNQANTLAGLLDAYNNNTCGAP